MKRIGLLLILLLATTGVIIKIGQQNKTQINTTVNSQNAMLEQNMFTVFVTSGDVYYGNDGNTFTKITEDNMDLPNLTYIQTKEGEAEVLLANNSIITLDSNTTIRVDSTAQQTTIKQLYGNTWHRVQDVAIIGDYNVETDNALAGVRGTIFGVNVSKETGNTSVYVVEHTVEVTKGEKNMDGTWNIFDKTYVNENYQVDVDKNKKEDLSVRDTDSALRESSWYLTNIDKDKFLRGNENEFREMLKNMKQQRKEQQQERQAEQKQNKAGNNNAEGNKVKNKENGNNNNEGYSGDSSGDAGDSKKKGNGNSSQSNNSNKESNETSGSVNGVADKSANNTNNSNSNKNKEKEKSNNASETAEEAKNSNASKTSQDKNKTT